LHVHNYAVTEAIREGQTQGACSLSTGTRAIADTPRPSAVAAARAVTAPASQSKTRHGFNKAFHNRVDALN